MEYLKKAANMLDKALVLIATISVLWTLWYWNTPQKVMPTGTIHKANLLRCPQYSGEWCEEKK